MEIIRAVIIDDEERARTSLQILLSEYCKNVEVVGLFSNVPEGVLAINKYKPNIVFLDIEMPEYNGFELFNFFREIDFEIIFVTAYNEFAVKAFEFSAIDYLLKPVDIEKLIGAVKKATYKINSHEALAKLELLKETYTTQQFNKIALPVSDGLSFVNTDEITYLEADGAYTEVWIKNGSRIVVSKKLKFFEDALDKRPNFFRSHRSFIVNINFIKKYSKAENTITLDNGKTVVISRDRKNEFEAQLKSNNLTVGN